MRIWRGRAELLPRRVGPVGTLEESCLLFFRDLCSLTTGSAAEDLELLELLRFFTTCCSSIFGGFFSLKDGGTLSSSSLRARQWTDGGTGEQGGLSSLAEQ